MSRTRTRLLALVSLPALALSACAVGPNYKRPPVTTPPAFKEADGWGPAAPSDMLDRGPWWTLFNDPDLDRLEPEVAAHNQNLAAAEAAYSQARALVAEARASFFPTVTLDPAFTESGGGGRNQNIGLGAPNRAKTVRSYQVSVGTTWAPDVWGKVRRQVESSTASAQASAANAANVRLSMQTELAADYMQLRAADEALRLYDETVKAYQTTLTVTRNQYKAGTQAKNAVDSAASQLYAAQAAAAAVKQSRQQFEHAIAVLTGQPPADLTIAPKPFDLKVPVVPAGVPTALLERRPDVAQAEREMKAANAQIGVAVAAFFPNLTLTGSAGLSGKELTHLVSDSNLLWSFGTSAAETVFQGGLRAAQVKAAKASYQQSVATYRQTVLTAFQQVEDELVALHMLEEEEALNRESSASADEAEKIVFNQYKAGTASVTDLVVAQATALNARRSLVTSEGNRLVAAVTLIEALGGGWNTKELPKP